MYAFFWYGVKLDAPITEPIILLYASAADSFNFRPQGLVSSSLLNKVDASCPSPKTLDPINPAAFENPGIALAYGIRFA